MKCDDRWGGILLPEDIRDMNEGDLVAGISRIRREMGIRLAILAHHYQKDEVVAQADYTGDSLELARRAASLSDAEFIVFCGVEFMVDMAAILARKGQNVITPAPHAGCPMADMAVASELISAWEQIAAVIDVEKLIPVTYVNSGSDVKAFCGDHGGTVCTSSNSRAVLQWAIERGECVLFLPDEHLGRNTARSLNIPRENIHVWDPLLPLGGLKPDALKTTRVLLWKGYCPIHAEFTPQQVRMARENYPGCLVIVHPECPEEVVLGADASGSTSMIIKYVAEAPEGSTIVVGTETTLVNRLTASYKDRRVVPLSQSLCPDMGRVNLRNLFWTLQNLGKFNVVRVSPAMAASARKALETMLSIV